MVDQIWADSAGDKVDWYHYQYDRAGNRTARQDKLVIDGWLDETYTYDDLDRLASWSLDGALQKSWDNLDGLGNDLDAGTYNAANEETPTGQGGDPYDAAGNMITLRSGNSAIYDGWNRMTKVTTGSGENLTILQQNVYDGANRRIRIFTNFSGSTPGTVADDYFRGQQVIETRQDAAVQYQYLWSPRYIDAPILRDTYNSGSIVPAERIFYLGDANYNVTGLVKQVSGTWQVVERYTYTPYGVVTYRNSGWSDVGSSANANTTLYTGRVLDLATGVMYYRGRFYDAVLERFVNRDPIGYSGGVNLYEYVSDDPTGATDPFGLCELPLPFDPGEAARFIPSLPDWLNPRIPSWHWPTFQWVIDETESTA